MKDQELFADYGYSFQTSPRWHRNLFRQHANENPSERNLKRLYQLKHTLGDLALKGKLYTK